MCASHSSFLTDGFFSTQFKLRHPVPSSPRLRMRRPQQGLELLKDQCLSCFLPFRGLSEVAQVAWGFTFEHKNGWPLFESETIRKWTCYDSEPCYETPKSLIQASTIGFIWFPGRVGPRVGLKFKRCLNRKCLNQSGVVGDPSEFVQTCQNRSSRDCWPNRMRSSASSALAESNTEKSVALTSPHSFRDMFKQPHNMYV